ncbi:uncharacterized protein LOC143296462 [Babylonia areolata]|uniref:uncharacterized protein LOC143296462 n=1 Tax=Babylonia areolata TaxID=304850 RepID=UPI003FD54BDB
MAGRKLTPEESRALFEKHETWCEVERTKEEAWCRKRRKHYKRHLVSHVFDHMLNKEEEPEPRVPFGIDEALHLQRRHFPPKHLVSKWTVL